MTRTTIETLQQVLNTQRKHIYDILTQITSAQLNWRPQSDRNSIGNLVEHLTGSERFWIQQGIAGIDVQRQRSMEFESAIRNKTDLENAYNTMKNESLTILDDLTDHQLTEDREIHNRVYSILGVLLQVIEHSNYHLGQIRYIQGLLKGKEFNSIPE